MKDQWRGLPTLPRRDLLKLFVVGGAGIIAEACGGNILIAEPREIRNAIEAQEKARQKGEVTFPLPQVAKDEKAMLENTNTEEGSTFAISFPASTTPKEIIFPSVIDKGKIDKIIYEEARVVTGLHDNPTLFIHIHRGDQLWMVIAHAKVITPLATEGQVVSMGDALFKLNLQEYTVATAFDGRTTTYTTKNARVGIGVFDGKVNRMVSEKNIIRDPRNPKNYLGIPTVGRP